MITAKRLAEICDLEQNKVLLYGYTHDRRTVVVFLDENDRLVRETTGRDGLSEIEVSKFVRIQMFTQIKRWYKGATNQNLRELFESFLEYGLPETSGGERMANQEYYHNLEDPIEINLDA